MLFLISLIQLTSTDASKRYSQFPLWSGKNLLESIETSIFYICPTPRKQLLWRNIGAVSTTLYRVVLICFSWFLDCKRSFFFEEQHRVLSRFVLLVNDIASYVSAGSSRVDVTPSKAQIIPTSLTGLEHFLHQLVVWSIALSFFCTSLCVRRVSV
jgi:hypothetical protein